MGYSPWDYKEWDATEQLSLSLTPPFPDGVSLDQLLPTQGLNCLLEKGSQ